MIYKSFLYTLLLFTIQKQVLSQHNFDSIRICHNSIGELSNLDVGEYNVTIQKGKLVSFSSNDGVISYQENDKLFIVTNTYSNSSLKIRLLKEGVKLEVKDTSLILNLSKSLNISSSKEKNSNFVLFSLRGFSFALNFKNEKISKISFVTATKFFSINLVQVNGVYSWDFGIESASHVNQLLLSYVFNTPFLFNINDDKNGIGVRLLSEKKNGFFNLLEGQTIYNNGSFVTDDSYKLQYANDSRLKKRSSKFNLECISK